MDTQEENNNKDVVAEEPQVQRTILKLSLNDVAALHSSYMPFVRGGAIFVPTVSETYKFGDEIIVSMHLKSTDKKLAIPGKVMWIAPETCERRTRGLVSSLSGRLKQRLS